MTNLKATRRAVMLLAGLLASQSVLADDQDALLLADATPASVMQVSDWKTFVEGSYARRDVNAQRLSFDLQYEGLLAPTLRIVLADRLDLNWPSQNGVSINTLKESYLGWQVEADTLLDIGRINVHEGVSMGYNPTDYFRSGAIRSLVSLAPASLKENRLGSVMLRGQRLWDSGSLTALFSPKLNDQANHSSFNPDWGATNPQDRVLFSVSQKISDTLKPQFLLYKEAAQSAQLGFNLTGLMNDATVAYFEYSGGRSASLLAQAKLPYNDDSAFRSRISTGLTYTTTNNISLTAELEYNGGGMSQSGWNNLYRSSPAVYASYRNWLQNLRESPTKQVAAFYGKWQDATINHLDLTAMALYDTSDYSRLSWLEARYHTGHNEIALQWQHNRGKPLSDFAASPQIQCLQLLLRQYW